MTRDTTPRPEVLAVRYQRRYSEQRFRFALWSEFVVGEMLPDTIVYQRLVLAIALQDFIHALRNAMRPLLRFLASHLAALA